MAWELAGEYFENCNCDILCPCITSSMQGPADYDRCLVPLICHIDRGAADGVSLDGLNFVMVVDAPPVMGSGGWRVALYIDERADEAQRDGLLNVLSGQLGGPPEMLAALIGEQLGVKFVRIDYASGNGRWHASIPGIMDVEVEPVTNPGTGEVLTITNTIHPMGADLPIGRGVKGWFDDPDYGLAFDNAGRNAHFREFAWSAA